MRLLFTSLIILLATYVSISQNVGIGNSNPQEKLDVNGNINLTGTIKANGISGQNGQVLKTNSAGNLEWSNPGSYSNFVSFNTGSVNWTIPPGVTKLLVEVWGAGGGGSQYGGGGGGGYIRAWFNVVPGNTVTGSIGTGGSGGTTAGVAGGASTATIAGYQLFGFGGSGSNYVTGGTSFLQANGGGSFSVNPGYENIIGHAGFPGIPNKVTYTQKDGTTFLEITDGGRGGDGANTENTGGVGGYRLRNNATSSNEFRAEPGQGVVPAGGGGGGHLSTSVGGFGANGRVIIWY